MTKDIALEIVNVDTYKCATYCEDVVAEYNVIGLLDTIYEDIDNQVCKNCKYYQKHEIFNIGDWKWVCTNKEVVPEYVSFEPINDKHGCNKFEKEI